MPREKERVREARYRDRHRATLATRQQERQRKGREWLDSLKGDACEGCGESFLPHKLHFHHRDPGTKLFGIGDNMTRTRAAILAEIAKCDVICGACHIRITDPRGWRRHGLMG